MTAGSHQRTGCLRLEGGLRTCDSGMSHGDRTLSLQVRMQNLQLGDAFGTWALVHNTSHQIMSALQDEHKRVSRAPVADWKAADSRRPRSTARYRKTCTDTALVASAENTSAGKRFRLQFCKRMHYQHASTHKLHIAMHVTRAKRKTLGCCAQGRPATG